MINLRNVILLFCGIMFAGCFANKPEEISPVGFLTDYTVLKPVSSFHDLFIFRNQDRKASIYRLVLIDPIKVYVRPGTGPFSAIKLDLLSRNLEDEIKQAMEYDYQLASQPAFGVLRVKAALTNITPDDSWIFKNEYDVNMREAVLEVELSDSLTGETVLSFVDLRQRKLRSPQNTREYSDEEGRIKWWANSIRDQLDQARGLVPMNRYPSVGAYNR